MRTEGPHSMSCNLVPKGIVYSTTVTTPVSCSVNHDNVVLRFGRSQPLLSSAGFPLHTCNLHPRDRRCRSRHNPEVQTRSWILGRTTSSVAYAVTHLHFRFCSSYLQDPWTRYMQRIAQDWEGWKWEIIMLRGGKKQRFSLSAVRMWRDLGITRTGNYDLMYTKTKEQVGKKIMELKTV